MAITFLEVIKRGVACYIRNSICFKSVFPADRFAPRKYSEFCSTYSFEAADELSN